MTTSGAYTFDPALGDTVLYAYGLCGIRNTAIVAEHMQSARLAMNFVLSDWSNSTPNLWKVDLVTVPLVQGQTTYEVDPSTVIMLDAYVTIDNGISDPIDRIILPVSRSEYATYPNKEQQGFPTIFWYNRLISPNVTIWPVPDGTSAQYLKYYRVRQVQDADFTSGQTLDVPYRWLRAFVDCLSLELARTWAPDRIESLMSFANVSYRRALEQDVESGANYYLSPNLSSYYRV